MRNLILLAAAAALVLPEVAIAQEPASEARAVDFKEWPVEWGGRPRDPHVAPDGKVWFVGQAGNYIAHFDPSTEQFRRYEIEEGTHPHNLLVDEEGIVWYAGHRNGRIGRSDPATDEIEVFLTGEASPHTMVFDGRGHIWFTSQNGYLGRFHMETKEVDLINPDPEGGRTGPYGIDVDPDGRPWASLFAKNAVATVDPETLEVEQVTTPEDGRVRRNAVTSDGTVWYVDFRRGYLGRIEPETRQIREWLMPGGEDSRPYAITADDEDRLWISQTGPEKRIVGFDTRAERFFSETEVPNTVRHMMFDAQSGTLWFGIDAESLGRIVTRPLTP